MKHFSILFVFLFSNLLINAQDYTWVKGSNTAGVTGTYGTQGVPAATNNPGARHGCGKWVDNAGNLWLFGGEGYSNSSTVCWMNDLWKYDVSTNEWTWIRGSNGPNSVGDYGVIGVPASTNEPPAREFMSCWTDNNGMFWMYGGDGVVSTATPAVASKLSDLWKYDPNTNTWTWIKGSNQANQLGSYGTQGVAAPSNMPPGRMGSAVWTDNAGDLWLFGGLGYASANLLGYCNDLWKYNISSNNWTWISGSNVVGQFGLYGTMGVPSATNAPGGRFFPNGFVGPAGELYLFGGRGFAASAVDYMNDMWKFEPTNGNWTWLHGSSNVNIPGNYGTLGLQGTTTYPGGRHSAASWKDASGNFWIFGGKGTATANNIGELCDLFRYNPAMNEWTWMKGPALEDQNGNYGTLGVTAASNNPGSREYNTYWPGQNNFIWLFGGEGWDATSTSTDHMNDLWKYKIPCNPDSITVTPGKSICSGESFTLTSVNGGPSTNWYTSPTSTNSIGGGITYTGGAQTASSVPVVLNYYAEANFCNSQPRPSISITVNVLPTLSVSTTNTLLCKGFSGTITASGANTYTWSTIPAQISASIIVTPSQNTTYTVTGTGINGCSASHTIQQNVVVCPGIPSNTKINNNLRVYPNPNNGTFQISLNGFNADNAQLIIFNALGQETFKEVLKSETNTVRVNLPAGIYFYQVRNSEKEIGNGKLILEF